MGASTFATSTLACLSAMVVAVELVTQPPQLKPTTARATAPPTAPHRAGLTFGEIFIVFPLKERREKFPDPIPKLAISSACLPIGISAADNWERRPRYVNAFWQLSERHCVSAPIM